MAKTIDNHGWANYIFTLAPVNTLLHALLDVLDNSAASRT